MDEAQKIVDAAVQDCLRRHVSDWGKIKNIIRDSLSDFLWEEDEEKSDDSADYYGSVDKSCVLYSVKQCRRYYLQNRVFGGAVNSNVFTR